MTKNKIYKVLGGMAAGAIAGYLYWVFIGCNTGSCPLTSNPYNTVTLFAAMGGFMAYDSRGKEKDNKTK